MNQHGFPCPVCGSADIRRSRRQNWLEIPKMLVGVYPFRCLNCGERFFGNVWILANGGHASCPKCLRLDLKASTKKDSRLTARERLMMALGAHMYRCVACRLNFLSMKPCLQITVTEPASGKSTNDLESP